MKTQVVDPNDRTEAPEGLLEPLRRRWSTRHFDPARPASREVLRTILDAARWAPSSRNEQPWRFLVFDDQTPEARERARACLNPGNDWARRAPVLMLSAAARLTSRGEPNRYALHDVGLATMALLVQATALGLATHVMGGFDRERVVAEFTIPDGFEPVAMIAVGYRGLDADMPPELAERERRPRTRLPFDETVRWGAW